MAVKYVTEASTGRRAMTKTSITIDRHAERGTALVAVLLLLMMMSALASVLAISGRTETLVARNHETSAQARAAAEAGLNRAAQVVVAWLAQWPSNPLYPNVNAAVQALLVDPTVLNADLIDFTKTYDDLATGIEYELDLLDEDSPLRTGGAQTLESDADASNNEAGNDPFVDENKTLILRAIGRGPNNARVELEAVIAPVKLPALVSGGDLTITGNFGLIAGDNGGVHANGALDISGSSVIITAIDPDTGMPAFENGTATSTGTYTASGTPLITGAKGGGKAPKSLPAVRASDYRSWADYILTSGGSVTDVNGAFICDGTDKDTCTDIYGWAFKTGTWEVGGSPSMGNGTFYVEGPVKMSGAGSDGDPLEITIIAEGSIDIGASNVVTPFETELLFVTDGDLNINGNFTIRVVEGQILVHEQVKTNGTLTLLGQIVIEDAENDDPLVDETDIGGNITITYTGSVGNTLFQVAGWREVR